MADPSGTLGGREIAQARLAKLPPFWKENPTLWFSQDAMFAISRITADTTKFHYIVANFNTEPLPFVSDIITNPPAQDKYDTLKERLINFFSETNESKLRRMFRGVEFFDEKPSNFLQRLRNLAGNQVGDTVLRTLFLEHLPEQVRGILSISEVADLTRLALQADKNMEVTKPTIFVIDKYPSSSASTTASKQSISNNSNLSVTLENLTARIDAITQNFEHLDQHEKKQQKPNPNPSVIENNVSNSNDNASNNLEVGYSIAPTSTIQTDDDDITEPDVVEELEHLEPSTSCTIEESSEDDDNNNATHSDRKTKNTSQNPRKRKRKSGFEKKQQKPNPNPSVIENNVSNSNDNASNNLEVGYSIAPTSTIQTDDDDITEPDVVEELEHLEPSTSCTIEESSEDDNNNATHSDRKTKNTSQNPRKRKRKSGFVSSWLNIPKFKGWLEKSSKPASQGNFAFCKVCNIDVVAHKTVLIKHSCSAKHKLNWQKVSTSTKITDLYVAKREEVAVKIAEIKLCALFATKNLPFLLMDSLSPLLKNIFPDSKIAQQLSLKRSKATAIICNSLGDNFLTDLHNKLTEPGFFFSLIMDETTDISVKKQCAFSVIFYDKNVNLIQLNL
ncbi:unnamed protein product [Ceutorhynchus assimilis]|uniref:DUF7041 domain-containing protein n=1 Tax=Ceutorhynchus assimilis TaxID=467358 RepID=A0A9N9QNI5_9CUCU|nr:unnamed protein product [Ceutorhynchus assimilis]